MIHEDEIKRLIDHFVSLRESYSTTLKELRQKDNNTYLTSAENRWMLQIETYVHAYDNTIERLKGLIKDVDTSGVEI